MKITDSNYQIINEPNIMKKIERIARVCYKSEDKIGDGTDVKMISNLIKRNHMAMLEHGNIVLEVDGDIYETLRAATICIESNFYVGRKDEYKKCYLRFTRERFNDINFSRYIVSGNIRAWIETLDIITKEDNCFMEKGWLMPYELYNSLLKEFPLFEDRYTYDNSVASRGVHFCKNVDVSKLSESERMVHETISVLFTSDLLIQRELVRHREASFAGESTRYCNYSLDKFGNEITVIKPCFEEGSEAYNEWLLSCKESERSYFALLNLGVAPQLARDVLPASTKCDTVVTANLSEWKHIFDLRACDATGAAHPKMKQIMIPLLKEVRPKYEFAFGNLITSDDIIII